MIAAVDMQHLARDCPAHIRQEETDRIGHGARVVTGDWDDDRRYDRISAWGHQPLRQP